jgi:2-polyprenyl-3-methyl-5-hydroxy-6-metoxy-1,4-benzoquinol methylase
LGGTGVATPGVVRRSAERDRLEVRDGLVGKERVVLVRMTEDEQAMTDRPDSGLLTPFLYRQRVRAVVTYLRGSVLDHGCGVYSLASRVAPENYLGVDIDEAALAVARSRHPSHRFATAVPQDAEYDTVASLAVIEHVADPTAYLRHLSRFLARGGQIVLTTPHPRMEGVYGLGAKLRLFSARASEEHEHLLDRRELDRCAERAGLRLSHYQTFLGGGNQLAVLIAATPESLAR